MTAARRRSFALSLVALALTGCATVTPALAPAPVHPNGQALWLIVHDLCIPNQQVHGQPGPCALVSMTDGFVLFKDKAGVSQYLLMPTAKITGTEDPALLKPDAVNYFAKAWSERGLVADRLGRPLARTQISIAVNSLYGRSQDQLHLHIDCLDSQVGAALQAAAVPLTSRWADQTILLKGHRYHIVWLNDGDLQATNPFKLLAHTMPGANQTMAAWTIAMVGAVRADGAQGFYLLADRADPATGDHASSEELQDHACRP